LFNKTFSKLVFAWNHRFKATVTAFCTNSLELAEYARTQSYLQNPCLDCENSDDTIIEKGEDDDEIYYEEPDLSGGVEGIDYGIVYGIGDEEVELEAEA
jgi:hypothetical protein